MNKKELLKLTEQELQWLKYYSRREGRDTVDPDNVYGSLIRMGYSKRQMALYTRCAAAMVTCDYDITIDTKIEDVHIVPRARNIDKNIHTSLEVYFILYPEERKELLKQLIS